MINSLKMESWPITKLIEYARNPRNNDDVVDQMVSVIKEFGFRIPIVARSDGLVVDGHLRLKAARVLGLEEVPVILADELTDTQVKAFRILANKSASWAEWDDELLRLEFEELKLEEYNLEFTGFSEDELNDLMVFDEVDDGYQDSGDEKEIKPADVTLAFGEYRSTVNRDKYIEFIEGLRQTVGFDKTAIVNELLRRLGL